MAKVTNISKVRENKLRKNSEVLRHEGFRVCSPDMTICGDCQDNRSKNKCPRLKEWLAKQKS
jgi:hypothetical protein